jgi:pimeloyl-ACP methyl ester carboxylesterase
MMTGQAQSNDFRGDVTQLSMKLRATVVILRWLDRISPAMSANLLMTKFVTPRRKSESDYSDQMPDGARRIEVIHNLTKITGWVWGDGGPSVLLLHGWEGHTGRMIPLIKPLLAQGYRVFTLDAPGHGLSPEAKTHLIDVGYAIQSMIEQYGPFYGIIAHSFGAAATSIMLAREPQLMPRKLVLMSPMRDLQQHLDIFSRIARLSADRKDRLRARVERRIGLPFDRVSTIEAVRTFRIPGLVIHDRHDTLIPYEVGEAVAANWTGARFVSTDKLGHRQGLNSADVLGCIMEYLAAEIHFQQAARVVRAHARVG